MPPIKTIFAHLLFPIMKNSSVLVHKHLHMRSIWHTCWSEDNSRFLCCGQPCLENMWSSELFRFSSPASVICRLIRKYRVPSFAGNRLCEGASYFFDKRIRALYIFCNIQNRFHTIPWGLTLLWKSEDIWPKVSLVGLNGFLMDAFVRLFKGWAFWGRISHLS